ncbi:hypothetical protein SLEP1_g4183 [Rubroshorea leprosula]|uniref:Uncharacterized protein n=1 Tax=Rubroshorea leprosula TaxID=152421 RepID=A0AAV5HMV1_9ROSI|nr:hypothetical protein SLEP1_g4183 [Rubroshorea leprosula]
MSKMIGKKTESIFTNPITGRSRTQRGRNLSSKSSNNVNEEYKEAFRTKSYIEMWSKAQHQLERTGLEKFSSSTLPLHHLSDFLLEPTQETLIDMMERLKIHQLLADYFKASFEACNTCELLLKSIHKTRANYQKIKRVIKISKRVHEFPDSTDDHCGGTAVIFKELAGFVLLKNPLLIISPMKFGEIHDTNMELLHKLTSKQKKIKRRTKLKRLCKRIGGVGLVVSHSALVAALLVLAFHSMIGIIAAPGLIACFLGFPKKKTRSGAKRVESSLLERLDVQLDIAAKGTFIQINDFDTMSRLVWRLYDEIEHLKAIAKTCVRNGKIEVLKEVVREFGMHESSFLEQLEELEENIYLCFHTINRSRRLVIEKIIDTQPESKT